MSALSANPENDDFPRNRLLRALPPHDRERVIRWLEPVTLTPRQILHHWNTPMEHAYFIERGLVSVGARGKGEAAVEVWLIGSEGMTGVPAVLGGDLAPPHRRVVQVGGSAMRLSSSKLRTLMDGLPALRHTLLRYVQVVLLQTSQTGLCNAHHSLQQRLSRWLLSASDGLESGELHLTHHVLARLLGVRRASVTTCLQVLEKSQAIELERGLIRILDWGKLSGLSCGCYFMVAGEYRRLLEQGRDSRAMGLAGSPLR